MLEPGREMDALIAERVIGEPFIDPMDKYFGEPECCPHCGRYCGYDCHYSTDDDAAWRVVRKMVDDGFQAVIAADTGEGIDAYVDFERGFEHSDSLATTFAKAVCVAALRALGVEV